MERQGEEKKKKRTEGKPLFASGCKKSRVIKEFPLGEWLLAGREEVVQINPDRKLSFPHCAVHVQVGSYLEILCY